MAIQYKGQAVYFQAHRGGMAEVPEHTMETYYYSWDLGGIPETDICSTQEGEIICLHDPTLGRTTNAPEPARSRDVSTLSLEEIKKWDAGIYYGEQYRGQKVPALAEVLQVLKENPQWAIYIDLKTAYLEKLNELITSYEVSKQVIFCHNDQKNLIQFSRLNPEVRTMLWIGEHPHEIRAKFEAARESGFNGLNQIQFHLYRKRVEDPIEYHIEDDYLLYALEETKKAGIDFQVLPYAFDADSLQHLLELGIRWYAVDAPAKFVSLIP